MVTYYNKKDMVSFGNYLLSDKRKADIEQGESNVPAEDRMKEVHHADIENWIETLKE